MNNKPGCATEDTHNPGEEANFLKINYDKKKIKNTVNKYMADNTTRSTYDLSVKTEVGRKSTTKRTR
jgi:hypothetical protein